MADLLNRANVDTAINTLLDDAQPNEAIQPSDHNGLLKNILDTLANGLSTTLRTNPETAGQDIEVTSGDKLKFKSSTFFNSVVTDTLTADRTLTLPNKTGTIAILSDIQNLFTDDLTLGANRSHNAVEYDWKITHNATDGSVNAVGIDTGKISHAGSRTATNSSYSTNWFWGQFLSTFTNTSTNANTNISQTNSVLQLSNTDAVNDTTTINFGTTALNAQHVGQTTQSDLVLQGAQAKLINSSGTGTVNTTVQLTNTDGSLIYSQGNVTSTTEVNNNNISLSFGDIGGNADGSNAGGSLILSNALGHEFTDNNQNGSGLKYALDYSANYTSRSLVDKAFVLANAGGDSIYTADGTLSANRIINLNGKNLTFQKLSSTTEYTKIYRNGGLEIRGSGFDTGNDVFKVKYRASGSDLLTVGQNGGVTIDSSISMGQFNSTWNYGQRFSDGYISFFHGATWNDNEAVRFDLRNNTDATLTFNRNAQGTTGNRFIVRSSGLAETNYGTSKEQISLQGNTLIKGDTGSERTLYNFKVANSSLDPSFMVFNNKDVIIGGSTKVSSENISLQGDTVIKGSGTLSTFSALKIYDGDGTPNLLWDFRNNGDLLKGDTILKIGNSNSITGTISSYAIGSNNNISGGIFGKLAIGDNNAVNGSNAYTIGRYNSISANNVFQFGNFLQSTSQGAFIIGHGVYSDSAQKLVNNTANSLALGWNTTTPQHLFKSDGVNLTLPTSSAGLSSGDIYNDGGTLKIV